MGALETLSETIKRKVEGARQSQIRFAECSEVQWDDKTMTATGTADDSEYLGVALGLGGIYTRPAVGSLCLIGIIEGLEVSAFLIHAETVECTEIDCKEISISSDKITFNGGGNFGAVKVKELTARLNAIEKAYNTLLNDFAAHNHAHPQGATVSLVIPPTAQSITETEQSEIENEIIKH